MRVKPVLALLFLLAVLGLETARAKDFYFWTQAVATGFEARSALEGDTCPMATIDGAEAKMTLRAEAADPFPAMVCALALPKGASAATIAGRPLPLPPARVDRILLIGDTGCRLKAMILQGCNSLKTWPLRLVADLAAEAQPDLVIHLGDLIYRERACPAGMKSCAGSPFGDNWESWKADWLDPARALLEAAPIVFVRGNHEDCERAGAGWTRLASAFPPSPSCAAQEPPFFVDLGGLTLAVLDVTGAEDRAVDDTLALFFKRQFAALASKAGPIWIAMHKPIYGAVRVNDGIVEGDNKTLVAATTNGLPPNVETILSGHLHLFQAMSYERDFPAQVIVGNGGDWLDALAPQHRLDGLAMGDIRVDKGMGVAGKFGYAMLQRQGDGWSLEEFDTHGAPLARCKLSGRKLDCD